MLTQSYLEEEYINKKKSANQISIETGILTGRIYDHLRLFNIPVRKKGPQPKIKMPKEIKFKPYISERDKEILALREQKISYRTIGEKFGITRERVRQILKKSGKDGIIEKYSFDENWLREKIKTTKPVDIAKELSVPLSSLSKKLRSLGLKYSIYNEEEKQKLYDLYIVQKKSQVAIGKELELQQGVVSKRLYHYGIITESQKGKRTKNWIYRSTITPEMIKEDRKTLSWKKLVKKYKISEKALKAKYDSICN